MLAGAAKETLKPETAITAAAIAYFALFSLFPITLLSISIASFSLGPSMDRQLIIQRLEFIAPAMGQLLGQNIDEIIEARGPVTGIALVGLIWSASTVFYTFTHTLNQIWGVKQRRAVWKRRGLAILFVLTFVGPALFLASFAGSMIAHLRTFYPPDHFDGERCQPGAGYPARCCLVYGALYDAPAWSFHLARDFTRRDRGWFPVGAGQESLPVFCFHLHLCLEPGLWFSGSHYCLSCLGISEQPHLSLWRLLKRFLFPTQTAAKRNARQNTSVRLHRKNRWRYQGLPQVAENNIPQPMDAAGEF
jgi:hypothetical protein